MSPHLFLTCMLTHLTTSPAFPTFPDASNWEKSWKRKNRSMLAQLNTRSLLMAGKSVNKGLHLLHLRLAFFLFLFKVFVFEIESFYVDQAGLQLGVPPPQEINKMCLMSLFYLQIHKYIHYMLVLIDNHSCSYNFQVSV